MEVRTQALELFQDVWPRQRAVKNLVTSNRLCVLLLSNSEAFSELVDVVLPLMTKISQGSHLFYRDKTNAIIKNYPERFLEVLHTVLPEDVSEWTYGIGEKLEVIAEADNSLRSDPRLVELNRKWAAR